ncbi:LysM peptidoglycan-binding domain-containing protein [Chromobacterium sp. S0633]|uniref:LysM peptidoglycan-binding domain-containing protein n=1 Tax=Chromobacterium sp. S0633 TaxID=2957805 RepID=UPI0020A1C2B0|nr:LysM peptidoglycan-binding domain-containing protein [Chromobacterium sp. S0633]
MYQYDGQGNVVSKTDAMGKVARYVYDVVDRQTFSIDAAGYVTERIYDAVGNVVETRRYADKLDASAPRGPTATTHSGKQAVRIGHQAGTNNAINHDIGRFQKGDTVTASVWFKTDSETKGHLFLGNLGGSQPYNNAVESIEYGNDGWRKLTVSRTLSEDLALNIHIYGPRDGAPNPAGHSVFYDDLRVESVQRGVVLIDGFEDGINGWHKDGTSELSVASVPLSSEDWTDATLRQYLSSRPGGVQQRSRTVYDTVGRATYSIDGEGYVTERVYDAVGNVVETRRYADKLDTSAPRGPTATTHSGKQAVRIGHQAGTNNAINHDIGRFQKGDTVTASVWFKTDSETKGHLFLGNLGGSQPYNNAVESIEYGNDGWRKLTVSRTLSEDLALNIHIYGPRDGAPNPADHPVFYDDLRVESVQRGVVLIDGFEDGINGWHRDGVSELSVASVPLSSEDWTDATLRQYLSSRPGGVQQQSRIVYDAAGRQRFAIDPQGYLTETRYGAAGQVIQTRRYAQALSLDRSLSLAQLEAMTAQASTPPTFNGTAGTQDNGRLHLISKPETGGSWASLNSARQMPAGSAYQFDLTPNQIQSSLHAMLENVGGKTARLAILLQPDGLVYAQIANANDQWRAVPMGAYQAGVTYTVELTTNKTGGTIHFYPKGGDRRQGYRYDVTGEYDWSTVQLRFATQRDPGLTVETTADIDNIEERGLEAQSTSYAYDAAGRLIGETRGDGKQQASTTYQLDALGKRIVETDAGGHTTRRDYDLLGRLIRETDALGGVTVTEYDAFGKAIKITDPRGYSGYNYYDALGRQTLHIDPEGYATATEYDALGQTTRITRYAQRVDTAALKPGLTPTLIVDAQRDAVTRIEHDALGRQTVLTDAEGGIERMEYDGLGNKTAYTNQLNGGYRYVHDAQGRVLKETSPLGIVKRFEYDGFGNRTLQVEAEGKPEQRTTRYQYDANNRLIRQTGDTLPVYTLDGGEATVSPSQSWRYDAAGRQIEFTDANGKITRSRYDALGRKVAERNGDGVLSEWDYDAAGNVLVQRVYASPVGLPADGGVPAPANADVRETRYVYDGNNRLQKTVVPSQTVIYGDVRKDGAPTVRVQDLVTERQYDANGNVVCEIDPRGNRTLRWYDLAGRKLLEVDAAGYAVAWSYNTAGKPVREVRYAAAVTAPVDGIALDEARGLLKPGAQDRISEFDYDRMGRLLEERRLNVDYYEQASLEASKKPEEDAIAQTRQTGVVRTLYRYNSLGLLTQKTDAKGAVTDIRYDVLGREVHREDAAFIDQTGQSVRPITDTSYNDLSLTTKVVKTGVDGVFSETHFKLGGRADWMRDAEGNVTFYDYDAVGNVTRTRRERKEAAGGQDVTLYAYNAAKLQTAKQDVATGVWQEVSYNAWGQITGKRTSINRQGDWQEFSEYDTAGRLIRGNAGGVTKLYGYDANGNSTLAVVSGRSQSDELRNLTLEKIFYRLSQVNNPNFQDDLDAFRLTVSDYDSRNLLLTTRQPKILNKNEASGAQVEAWTVAELQTGRGDVVTTEGSVNRLPSKEDSVVDKSSGIEIGEAGKAKLNLTFFGVRWYDDGWGPKGAWGYWADGLECKIKLPTPFYESGDSPYEIEMLPGGRYVDRVLNTGSLLGGFIDLKVDFLSGTDEINVYQFLGGEGFVLNLFKKTTKGRDLVTSFSVGGMGLGRAFNGPWDYNDVVIPEGLIQGGDVHVPRRVYFKNQSPNASRLIFLTRPAGSSIGWTSSDLAPMKINGGDARGWFVNDWSAGDGGDYDFRYLVLDEKGKVLNANQGLIRLGGGDSVVVLDNVALNKAFMSADISGGGRGWINVFGLGEGINRALVRFRAPGQAWSDAVERSVSIFNSSLNGSFRFNPADYGLLSRTTYEYDLEYYQGKESRGRVVGNFRLGEPDSVICPVAWQEKLQLVHINNQLESAAKGVVRFRQVGSQGSFGEMGLIKGDDRKFTWDCTDLVRTLSQPSIYEFEYQIFDVDEKMINRAQGSITLGGGTVRLDRSSVSGMPLPMYVSFFPDSTDAVAMELQYRIKGGGGAWYNVELNKKTSGNFFLNVDDFPVGDYEYSYRLIDSLGRYIKDFNGNSAVTSGFLRRGNGPVFRPAGMVSVSSAVEDVTLKDEVSVVKNGEQVKMFFDRQPSAARRIFLIFRPINGWWRICETFREGGGFSIDLGEGYSRGFEYRYFAVDSQKNIVNSARGYIGAGQGFASGSYKSGWSPSLLKPMAFLSRNGSGLSFINLGVDAKRAEIRFKKKDGVWSRVYDLTALREFGVSSDTKGWFQIETLSPKNPLFYGGDFEYQIETFDGRGTLVGSFNGFASGAANRIVATDPVRVGDVVNEVKQSVVIKNRSPFSSYGKLFYIKASGAKSKPVEVGLRKLEGGDFSWDVTGVEVELGGGYYNIEYQIFDSFGRMIDRASCAIKLGAEAAVFHAPGVISLPLPDYLNIDVRNEQAEMMDFQYKSIGKDEEWKRIVLKKMGTGNFWFSADELMVGGYEYRYCLLNSSGKYLLDKDGGVLQVSGYWRRGSNSQIQLSEHLQWVLQGVTNSRTTITHRQIYNAFGEVISETDGAGNSIRTEYNTAGKLVAKREAALKLRDDNGDVLKNIDGSDKLGDEAVTRYGYDAVGNLVSSIDANGHENRQRWLAGSQEGQGKVLRERHADGSSKEMAYDSLGNLRIVTVNGQRQQDYQYDKLGRLKRLDRAQRVDGSRGYDEYDYDSAGQRIAHRTSDGKTVFAEATRYDSLGRVLETVSAASRHTTYSYAWDAQLKGAGGIVVGGWRTTTTNANNMTMQDAVDLFGLKSEHRDLGGRVTQYQYNNAGQLIRQQSDKGQNILYTYYGNGNLQGMEDRAANRFTLYGYDDDGRKNYEAYASGPDRDHLTFYQQSVMRYDERGRVIEIKDPRFLSRYQYDAVGNRQRVYSEYQDGKDGSKQVQDNWYAYDAMNRFTVTQGSRDASGNIMAGSRGIRIEYDGFGQRAKASNGGDGTVETYSYTADGFLTDTQINGKLAYRRSNDLLGRVTDAESFSWDGQAKARKTHTDYDADNKMLRQVVDGKATKYGLMADGTLKSTQQEDTTTVTTYYEYEWWDEAKQSKITAQPYNKDAPDWRPGISHLTYDVNGHLKEAIDEQGQRSLRYINDAQGVVIRREELDKQSVYKRQDYYYVDGKQVGAVGNDGPSRMDFAQALAQGQLGGKKDQYRFGVAVSSADFDQNYEPIAPNYPGQAPSTVTVRGGDTLQSLAAGLWGDKSLWYLLADANGLTGSETLAAGQALRVPNKVTNLHNSSGTYRVYSPGEAIGDVTPTLPDPPPPPPRSGGGGCGGLGTFIVMVIVMVVAYYVGPLVSSWLTGGAGAAGAGAAGASGAAAGAGTAGATAAGAGATAAGSTAAAGTAGAWGATVAGSSITYAEIAGAVVGGAAGSAAGQGAAMAMGMQDRFSWQQVGLSAITAGAMRYTGGVNLFADKAFNSAAQAMVGSTLAQGVAMATGLQKSFNWTAVGVAGVAAWATSGIKPDGEMNSFANVGYGTVRGMVGGAIQSVLGENHQPNWSDLAANSFGSALGDQVVSGIQKRDEQPKPKPEAERMAQAMEEMLIEAKQSRYDKRGVMVADASKWQRGQEVMSDAGSGYSVDGNEARLPTVSVVAERPRYGLEALGYRSGADTVSDLGSALWNAGLNLVEGSANLFGGFALPGGSDYVPFLDSFRSTYKDAEFGQVMEVGIGLGAGGLGGMRAATRVGKEGVEVLGAVKAYRVEGTPNQRFVISEYGQVSLVPGNNSVVWLNFGQEGRATQYLQTKIEKGLPGAELKSFDVDLNLVKKIRTEAVPERFARQYPDKPIVSRDPYPDQFGLPKAYFDELMKSISQGTGRIGK